MKHCDEHRSYRFWCRGCRGAKADVRSGPTATGPRHGRGRDADAHGAAPDEASATAVAVEAGGVAVEERVATDVERGPGSAGLRFDAPVDASFGPAATWDDQGGYRSPAVGPTESATVAGPYSGEGFSQSSGGADFGSNASGSGGYSAPSDPGPGM